MENERILFLIPPYFNIDDYGSDARSSVLPPFTMPYGILSLSAFLAQRCAHKPEVRVLDLNVHLKEIAAQRSSAQCELFLKELLLRQTREFQPTIVGISALFNITFRYIEELAKAVKSERAACLVLAGGGLPSAAYKEVLELSPSVDAICRGEGEIPLAELVDAKDKARLLAEHPSWMTRAGIAAGKEPRHSFVQELDQIPMFDYGIIRLDDYNSRSIDKRHSAEQKREMTIHTSRGCPFSCVFCSNPFLHGNKVRAMSIERVVDEVRVMKEKYGLTVLLIEDDHFFFDVKRAKEILRRLAPLEIRIEFPNGIAVYAIDDEVARLLGEAGASTVALAVESGSDHVLRNIIGKPLQTGMVKGKVEMLRRHGVQSHAFIVIGLPGEHAEHREETLELLLDVGFDWAHIFCAVPIFGSRLYDICMENGYIQKGSFLEHVMSKSVITAPGVDPQEIERTAYDFNLNVNFVNNYNLKIGNYETAVKYFANVTSKYPEHAFGRYCLAEALAGAGDEVRAAEERAHFDGIIARDPWWRSHADRFGLTGEPGRSPHPTA